MAYIGQGLTLNPGNIILPVGTSTSGNIISNSITYFSSYRSSDLEDNLIFGQNSGNFTFTGTANTAFGSGALRSLTSGTGNICIGRDTGQALTTGNNNIFIGTNAAWLNQTTASSNVVVGGDSLNAGNNANSNVVIGYNCATAYTTTEHHNILIGTQVPGVAGEVTTIRLGNISGSFPHTQCFIGGIYGRTTTSGTTSAVLVSNGGQLGTISSSARLKQNIRDMESSPLMKLRPVNFSFKSDETHQNQYGLIAEEVHEIMPDIVNYDDEGKPFSVRYHDLPSILLNELIKLSTKHDVLQHEVAELRNLLHKE